ncbi:MAG: hypothetical protein PHY28_02110 [Dehalococcoidales bacterium]|nr:hypothetical protein [Dehalococcoidales bacterium]
MAITGGRSGATHFPLVILTPMKIGGMALVLSPDCHSCAGRNPSDAFL